MMPTGGKKGEFIPVVTASIAASEAGRSLPGLTSVDTGPSPADIVKIPEAASPAKTRPVEDTSKQGPGQLFSMLPPKSKKTVYATPRDRENAEIAAYIRDKVDASCRVTVGSEEG